DLDGLTCADRPLDADRGRLTERDVDPEVIVERGLDDFLLDLAVERHGDLPAGVVLSDVDERVLLGKLRERYAEPRTVFGRLRDDDRLQRRRGKLKECSICSRPADPVADLDLVETPEL